MLASPALKEFDRTLMLFRENEGISIQPANAVVCPTFSSYVNFKFSLIINIVLSEHPRRHATISIPRNGST